MRIIVCENYEEVSKKAAQMILSQVNLLIFLSNLYLIFSSK